MPEQLVLLTDQQDDLKNEVAVLKGKLEEEDTTVSWHRNNTDLAIHNLTEWRAATDACHVCIILAIANRITMVPMESCSVVEWLRQIPKQIQYYNKRQAGLTETDLYRNRGKIR